MESYSILHEVGIKASPGSIYEALTDTKKLAAWWVSDARGVGNKVGGVLEFSSGESLRKFEVVELQPGKLVRWSWKGDEKDEWAGTEVTFKISPDENQCWLNFRHSGFQSDQGCLPHCSTKWAVFMLSFKDLLEKGKGQPAPNDVQIYHDSSQAEYLQSA